MSIFRAIVNRIRGKKPQKPTRKREPKLVGEKQEKKETGNSIAPRDYAPARKTSGKGKNKEAQQRVWKARRWRIALILFMLCAGVVGYFTYDLPDISKLTDFKKAPSITVKAEDGTVLGTYGDVYGDYLPYDQMPKHLIDAVIATEDRNFYYHFGVDPQGLARAMYVNVRAGKLVQGGSTITQQVAKNVFLTSERTFRRKIQEMLLAFYLEARFSKEDIITIYLNRVYMGAGNYGVDAASRRYFSHSARELTIGESAVLTGLLKAPSRFSPTNNPELSEKRAWQVLVNMVDAGKLTQAEAEKAKAELKIDEKFDNGSAFASFYFTDWVVDILPEFIGSVQDDIEVVTTLDPKLQLLAADIINKDLEESAEKIKASQSALVSMSPDGAIRVMVGGRNYQRSQYNRAVQAMRQPGSSFKPFVYLAGIEAGFMPDSMVEDKPISVGRWTPHNYTGRYEGIMTMRDALAHSINTVAVQISELVGRDKVVEMAHRLGIGSEIQPLPSIALGSIEVNLLELTGAYAHLAANGKGVIPFGIREIKTGKGNVLYSRAGSGTGYVLRPNVVAMMNNMLMAVVQSGTGTGANIGRPAAGKTGTTSDYKDAWFVGYTPDLATGVWLGNDDNTPMKKVTGGNLPARIWREFMSEALKEKPVSYLPTQMQIDPDASLPWLSGSGGAAPRSLIDEQSGIAPTQGQPGPGEVELSPGFWDTLFGGGEGSVEHDYPSQKRR